MISENETEIAVGIEKSRLSWEILGSRFGSLATVWTRREESRMTPKFQSWVMLNLRC